MSTKSSIEWTDSSWNPVVGCEAVSSGCDNCYAERDAGRLVHLPAYEGIVEDGQWTGVVRCLPERLDLPARWKKPRRIFVNSMSDLFHPKVPSEFIARVFDVMGACPWHHFQVLTKRPNRMAVWTMHYYGGSEPPPNIWLGTSVENQGTAWRSAQLGRTPAAVRFLSVEPLLGPISPETLHLDLMDWIIVGGESGPKARPMLIDWVRELRDASEKHDLPFFFKQAGAVLGREWGCQSANGHDIESFPAEFQVREYPDDRD